MNTQELRHRVDDNTNPTVPVDHITTTDETSNKTKRDVNTNISSSTNTTRMALAKRGLKSLAITLAIPMSLNLISIALFGSGQNYKNITKWVPPLWPLHTVTLLTSLFMSLAAWLFWAEGGFHRRPRAVYAYAVGIVMNVLWDPVVLGFGASWVGLGVCVGLISALVGCYREFRVVNLAAGQFVMPCFGLACVLALVNLRLACI